MSTRMQPLFGWVALVVCISLGTAQQKEQRPCPDVPSKATLDKTRYSGVWYTDSHLYEVTEVNETCLRSELHVLDNGDMMMVEYFKINMIPYNLTSRLLFSFPDEPARFQVIWEIYAPELLPSPEYTTNDVWVVDTDYDTYNAFYRCVGNTTNCEETLYILSRRVEGLDSDTFEKIKKNLIDVGVRLDTLEKVDHSNCQEICFPNCPDE